ncbi:transglycosylase SLT domain-containing protein [Chitinilyticum piscinae]|uniref:Transglycosylase SLT domain-containing protein n=1 Tax=Chitinilyticum piscinae TaxID=2866724 RepID=A0A8J7FMB9_9NEIS|nr:transglycosylase SLT domain-containing protein [Chitinilyticum piscinae]MBE9609076.1 transglycosylase SLT domain-containing protein [Chitinilyticum piscinae]
MIAKYLITLPSLALVASAHAGLSLDTLKQASKTRDIATLQQLVSDSEGDVLEMYPRYYLLSTQIRDISETDASAFLQRYDNTPIAERFRGEWLKELGRRNSWASYSNEYGKLVDPAGTELQCLRAQAGMALQQAEAVSAAKPLWFSDKALPDACNPVFDALFASGELGSNDAWARIRQALAANRADFARQLAARVGPPAALSAKSLDQAGKSPEKTLQKLDTGPRAERELALYALEVLGRKDPDAAAARIPVVSASWPEADQRFAWQQLGLSAARKLHPSASAWLARGGMEGLNDEERGLAIRAALRSQDWPAVQARIDALPTEQRGETTWRYWRARALAEQGRSAEARNELAQITQGYDYYSLLAREELGSALQLPPATRTSEEDIRQVRQIPAIRRALALYAQNWKAEGAREWNWAVRSLGSDSQYLAAAELARREGWNDRSIYTADRTRQQHDFALRYPMPWRSEILNHATGNELEAAWVLGIIRQESRFVVDARSGAGAAGLMQLMPATAKWSAKRAGLDDFSPAQVINPETNIALGTTYMNYLQGRFSGNQILSTAGYNAGPGNASKWQTAQAQDATIYIETIPFSETREYVKRVSANATIYAQQLRQGEMRLKARLQAIAPRGIMVSDGAP